MSDHLPECPLNNIDIQGLCMCPELRACEQRVLAEREADGPWFRSVVHDCCVDKQTAYAAGLDAAREAVAASWTGWCSDPTTCTDYEHVCQERHQALAAIDALRDTPTRISGQDPL